MNNPFEQGDIVYEPFLGECIVMVLMSEGCVVRCIKEGMEGYSLYSPTRCLSYQPWPEPVHVKPVI